MSGIQLHPDDIVTTLQEMGEQPLTPDSLVPIVLRSGDGWDQVVAFVALTMRHKMELAQEQQRQPIAAATQHPVFTISNPAMEETEDDPGWSTSESSGSH